ncbi:hypothetical protein AGMMS50268_40190 [Spirochaetia bacterium]|nr:hypothetical protein AGMMS50268_40190 [Spirochaetia bacterium]
MSDPAVLLEEIQSLPPNLAAEALDFVGYLKQKSRKEIPGGGAAAPRAGKSAVLSRFTMAQIEEWAQAPEIQALVGALKGADLPPDITMKDIREMRLAEKYGSCRHQRTYPQRDCHRASRLISSYSPHSALKFAACHG